MLPAHVYMSICVLSWGLIASFQALVRSFPSLLICRLLLGFTEAAFSPGIPFYFSFFFRRNELAFRIGLLISAAPLAGSFASSLAYGIVKFGSHTGIQPWRMLFLVEGFPSVVVAIWVWWVIPDSPATARWLNAREQRIATLRLRSKDNTNTSEKPLPPTPGKDGNIARRKPFLNWRGIGKTLADPKSYITSAMFFSVNVAFSSMPVFEPIIVKA